MRKLNQSGKIMLKLVACMTLMGLGLVAMSWGQALPKGPVSTGQQVQNSFIPPGCKYGINCTPIPFYAGVYEAPQPILTVTPTFTPVFTPLGTSPTFTPVNTATPPPMPIITDKPAASVTPTVIITPTNGYVTDIRVHSVVNPGTVSSPAAICLGNYIAWSDPCLAPSGGGVGNFTLQGDPFLPWGLPGTSQPTTLRYVIEPILRPIGQPFKRTPE